MYNVMFSIGGCGSVHIYNTAKKLRLNPGRRPGKLYSVNNSFFSLPTRNEIKDLKKRTGWKKATYDSTNYDIFIKYLNWVREKGYLASLNFYSYNSIVPDSFDNAETIKQNGNSLLFETLFDCFYLIRHPLYQYLSFGRPERHGKLLDKIAGTDQNNGLHHKKCIQIFMNDWLAEVQHFENNPNRKALVRFEYARSDSRALDEVTMKLFEEWDQTKRSPNILSDENTSYMYEIVKEKFNKYYDEWNI